jgi:periplasmic divalent cation tolerance protein
MSIVMVYVTCASELEAERIAQAAVRAKLAACANIVPKIRSFFHWKKQYHDVDETLLIFKTRKEKFRKLEKKVKAMHSYQVPCIVMYPAKAASKPYEKWVRAETR